MKTNYFGHEGLYKKRFADGFDGWDFHEGGYETFQAAIGARLDGPHAPKSGRLLDLGCGAGNNSVWYAERGYQVAGIDIAPSANERANERASVNASIARR